MMSAVSSVAVVHRLHGQSMGTSWSVRLVAGTNADLHGLHAGVQGVLDRIVAQMSTWEAESDISRFNRSAPGQWHTVPAEFMTVLRCALSVAEASGGAFDPSVGALVGNWGFGAHASAQGIADERQHERARTNVGWKRLHIDEASSRVLQPGELQLDFSAIAKGHGVDAVIEHLRQRHVAAALVEVGGELHGYGRKPDGECWRVLVESSPDEEAEADLPARVIALDERAVATSGDRWHAYESDGERFSHTLDPRSGRPVRDASAAVTVIMPTAMEADAWATALTVLGAEEGLALAERLRIPVRYVERDAGGLHEHCSSALASCLVE